MAILNILCYSIMNVGIDQMLVIILYNFIVDEQIWIFFDILLIDICYIDIKPITDSIFEIENHEPLLKLTNKLVENLIIDYNWYRAEYNMTKYIVFLNKSF